MDRKEFLRKSLGLVAIVPLVNYAKDPLVAVKGSSVADCNLTSSETAGPFPTKAPGSLVIKDIRGDRSGIGMQILITIKNKNNGCAPLAGAFVDIWHCDADGNYSEYGGTGMQAANHSNDHFLRGRQVTDANGQVNLMSIFPGWYPGRAVHIHVHVFDTKGKSLLVTQIAFPAPVCDAVFTSSTQYYKKGKANTSNERDNVFRDGFANELAVVTGNPGSGYALSHTIVVNG